MAYVNVEEWNADQVTDWLKGLDDSMYNYVCEFANKQIDGKQLLHIRPFELEEMGMLSIGHQEIVLEAVEKLRNFHYNLEQENLQFLALHVATAAHSLHRQLNSDCDGSKIDTQILNDISNTIGRVKPLIGWLDRAPFHGQQPFAEILRRLLRLGLEMATIAQRDRFVERPVDQIRTTVEKLENYANYIIQDIKDPMVLQPASISLVTLKKRESELGFNIESSYRGIHRVTDIKYNSPAHNSGKIEEGDEIMQINFQTVVGWQDTSVLQNLRESLPDVLLTLKKRPKHTKIYGQIYMQPYRLPSKKRSVGTRWGENVPNPRRVNFLTVPDGGGFKIQNTIEPKEKATAVAVTSTGSDTDSSCSDILTPTDTKDTEEVMRGVRLYYPKPRALLQRRNTVCGDEWAYRTSNSASGSKIWREHKSGLGEPASPSLRDKSVSFGFGLEITPRPTTCIPKFSGSGSEIRNVHGDEKSLKKLIDLSSTSNSNQKNSQCKQDTASKPGVSKVVRFDANMKYEDYTVDEKYTCNVQNTILETFEPIPFADEEDDTLETLRNSSEQPEDMVAVLTEAVKRSSVPPLAEAVNIPILNMRRGRLDKSHSTPAYDNTNEESDTPPAIEPRMVNLTPPAPPPRPSKQKDLKSPSEPPPPPPPKPLSLLQNTNITTENLIPVTIVASSLPAATSPATTTSLSVIFNAKTALNAALDSPSEVNELLTPTRTKTLTLRKKQNLIVKRRNVNLKFLGTGDIQGHLYRRTKDRRGVTFWAKLYFVMLDTIMYGFRSKESTKASSLIFLPGFTVSLAKEVHSKPHAFKVYHSGKTFYFAAESQNALNQWVEFIRQATIRRDAVNSAHGSEASDANTNDLFSETDTSGDENDSMIAKNLCTPSPQGSKDISSSLTTAGNETPTTSSKSDRGYLGSLRKLTKGTLPFKSSSTNEKKLSSDIPVPTEQYRCYRKVQQCSGIQIGTSSPCHMDAGYTMQFLNILTPQTFTETNNTMHSNMSTVQGMPVTTHSLFEAPSSNASPPLQQAPTPIKPLLSASRSSLIGTGEANGGITQTGTATPSSPTSIGPPASPAPVPSDVSTPKKPPYNFMHASNPNLVEFDFQTSKALDYSRSKINNADSWEPHPNIHGCITLKDLMLQKREEESQEMYNNRVFLGVEKKSDERRRNAGIRANQDLTSSTIHSQTSTATTIGGTPGSGGKISKTQNRSLPKTPDYEISFKPDDEDIKRTRTKEGLKLRDFGYELISGDDPIGGSSSSNTSRHNSNASAISNNLSGNMPMPADHAHHSKQKNKKQFLLSHRNKKHSSNSCSSTSSTDFANIVGGGEMSVKRSGTGSFKKKGKFEAIKTPSEWLFPLNKLHGNSTSSSAMTLPLNRKSNHHTMNQSTGGLNDSGSSYFGDYESSGSSCGIKKSHTYNHDLKERADIKYESHRKNSAPIPIFSKLTTATSMSSTGGSGSSANVNNNKTIKEKRFLGSPLLPRALFGSGHHNQNHLQQLQQQQQPNAALTSASSPSVTCIGREYDEEIFSQVTFSGVPTYHGGNANGTFTYVPPQLAMSNSNIATPPDIEAPPPPSSSSATAASTSIGSAQQSQSSVVTTPEYPNMECPPVFEPEIYSLTEPTASLFLLRNNNNINTNANNNNNNIPTECSNNSNSSNSSARALVGSDSGILECGDSKSHKPPPPQQSDQHQ